MQFPDDVSAYLRAIDQWAIQPMPELTTNDDFMTLGMELMNHAQYLLLIGISLAPSQMQAENGVARRRAIVLGHLVRIHKLYDALRYHTANKERDICHIFTRLIVETSSKAQYLMKAKNSSFRSFVLTSYRPEKEMLEDLRQKAATRPLLPIERRMVASIMRSLKEDRVSLKALKASKHRELDGKTFRQMLSDIGDDSGYVYGFGMGSHWIHGDWFDLRCNHLEKIHGKYRALWGHGTPDPRGVGPATIICLSCVLQYIKWNRSDPGRVVLPTIRSLLETAHRLDAEHEISLR